MKKNIRDPFKNLQLDSYEKELNDAIESGQVREVQDMEEEKNRMVKIFRDAKRKDRRVNLRVNDQDLVAIRAKAAENGLPYQTLISTILHQVATGKVVVTL